MHRALTFRDPSETHDEGMNTALPPNDHLTVYACPYYPLETPEIQALPPGVGRLILAFAGPAGEDGGQCTTDYMFSTGRTEVGLVQGIQELQERGVKVGIALIDNPKHQWPNTNLPAFVRSLNRLIQRWRLDFADIDAESSSATAEDWVQLVQTIQQVCQVPVTYTTYGCSTTDQAVLRQIGPSLDRIHTMSYSNDLTSLQEAYRFYAQFGAPVAIGSKQGDTSFETAVLAATWPRPEGKPRMSMLWNLNRQGPQYSPTAPFAYIQVLAGLLSNEADEVRRTLNLLPQSLQEACLVQQLVSHNPAEGCAPSDEGRRVPLSTSLDASEEASEAPARTSLLQAPIDFNRMHELLKNFECPPDMEGMGRGETKEFEEEPSSWCGLS